MLKRNIHWAKFFGSRNWIITTLDFKHIWNTYLRTLLCFSCFPALPAKQILSFQQWPKNTEPILDFYFNQTLSSRWSQISASCRAWPGIINGNYPMTNALKRDHPQVRKVLYETCFRDWHTPPPKKIVFTGECPQGRLILFSRYK